jgi:hypothetical protein
MKKNLLLCSSGTHCLEAIQNLKAAMMAVFMSLSVKKVLFINIIHFE